jgi:hypothetical protein
MEDFLVDQEEVQIVEQTIGNSGEVITIGIWKYNSIKYMAVHIIF